MAESAKYVIIGASTASISAVEAIRKVDRQGSLVVISKEEHHPYTPMILPYVLDGTLGEEELGLRELREEDFFERNAVRMLRRKEVREVRPVEKSLVFKDSGRMGYEKLLIATGAQPIIPNIPGIDLPEICVLRTLEDAVKIKKFSEQKKTAAVIGAGLIAMHVAEILSKKGVRVTVVEKMPHIVPQSFDAPSAAMMRKVFEDNGIVIHTGVTATRFVKKGSAIQVGLDSGTEVEVDFVLLAVGVRPAIGLVNGSGIFCNRGIVSNERMQTNIPDIYTAGDISEAKDFFSDGKIISPIQPDAVEQGLIAGFNMTGKEERYAGGISMNIFRFFGNNAFSIGLYNNLFHDEEIITHSSAERIFYRKIVISDDRLSGAIFMNDDVDPGIVRNLIRNRTNLGDMKPELISKGANFETWYKWLMEEEIHKRV
ncbi:MAG: FAD-dependent oxidoreductase [Nitrospirae bacterium]|nr:FAD-dependent oxidoreductase [Nitrospirota bacterium]